MVKEQSKSQNAVDLYDPTGEKGIPLIMRSNDDDRRQWRKQGVVVGAAASKTRVPPKARCGCWVPQPGSSGAPFQSFVLHKKPGSPQTARFLLYS